MWCVIIQSKLQCQCYNNPHITNYDNQQHLWCRCLVLVQMSTESAQTTCMHCYKFQTPADTIYLQANQHQWQPSIDNQSGRSSSELSTCRLDSVRQLGQHVDCIVLLSAAVAVVLIQVSRCKGIHFKQIDRLGSLEHTTTVFEVSKSCHNQRTKLYSKTIKFEILSRCVHTVLSSAQFIATSEKSELQTYKMADKPTTRMCTEA